MSDTTWGSEPGTDGKPSITFGRNGHLSGSDGCNLLTGRWKENARTVALDMATTLKYCEGIDTWLSTAATAKLSNSELVFFDTDGKEVGKLTQFNG
ncbi:META domain-containing protein [Corynebacterium mayonis]|uniref:META domain-containing protein n=1 Tax=Corynebacterium mayonis TaxID=3062461 RepID=UPI0031401CA0